jgi:hypothetical protein
MIRFRHYADAHSLGFRYVFGFNIYGNLDGRPTIDLILGKHVFVLFWDRNK